MKVKNYILSAVLSLLSVTMLKASPQSLWDEANTLYVNGDYQGALILYDSIASQGYQSGPLYYNIANANFKIGNLGESILYYHRAERLMPYDADLYYNLALAESRTKDRIETIPRTALSAWLTGIVKLLPSNGWATLSLLLFSLTTLGVLVRLLFRHKRLRCGGVWSAVTFGTLFIVTLLFAVAGRRHISRNEGVVMVSATSVHSSPESSGREIFILHEGTIVEVLGDYGAWAEISLADGNKGWMQKSALEII